MPNMSRKTIHSLDDSTSLYSENVAHKKINTDLYSSQYTSLESDAIKPKQLFNNNQEDSYQLKKYAYSRWTRFTRSVISVFTSILTVFYYIYEVQTGWFSHVHRLASKVMLFDTWLLWKTRPADKSRRIIALCLIPLLLFGGWWLMSGLGSILYETYMNYTAPSTEASSTVDVNTIYNLFFNTYEEDDLSNQKIKESGISSRSVVDEEIVKISEKYYKNPPTPNEIARSLTQQQLEGIAAALKSSIDIRSQINSEELIEKIVSNPNFQTVINNYKNIYLNKEKSDSSGNFNREMLTSHEDNIKSLEKEINNIKGNLLIAEQSRKNDHAQLTYQINRCCRRPIINIERYIDKIVSKLLNDPIFLTNQKGFSNWLHSLFVAKRDLEYHLGNLTTSLNSKLVSLVEDNSKILMENIVEKISAVNSRVQNVQSQNIGVSLDMLSDEYIKKIVKNSLAIYDADKTGLVDYAMETMGGQIVTTRCTENYHYGKAVVSVLGIPLWYPVNSPRTVITPSMHPGECWAFQNFPGFIVIKLSNKVKIEAFSMEHISRLLVPEGKIDSAPKDFEVYGLVSENDREPVLLGSYIFDYNGDPLQFFYVQKEGHIFDMIEVRIVSNHGNPNYTCLYRFRVHGTPHHENE